MFCKRKLFVLSKRPKTRPECSDPGGPRPARGRRAGSPGWQGRLRVYAEGPGGADREDHQQRGLQRLIRPKTPGHQRGGKTQELRVSGGRKGKGKTGKEAGKAQSVEKVGQPGKQARVSRSEVYTGKGNGHREGPRGHGAW